MAKNLIKNIDVETALTLEDLVSYTARAGCQ